MFFLMCLELTLGELFKFFPPPFPKVVFLYYNKEAFTHQENILAVILLLMLYGRLSSPLSTWPSSALTMGVALLLNSSQRSGSEHWTGYSCLGHKWKRWGPSYLHMTQSFDTSSSSHRCCVCQSLGQAVLSSCSLKSPKLAMSQTHICRRIDEHSGYNSSKGLCSAIKREQLLTTWGSVDDYHNMTLSGG